MSHYDLGVICGFMLGCGLLWFWIWYIAKKEGGNN